MCSEATAERILKTVRGLPEEEALEVLDFAEFLKARRRREDQEDVSSARDVLKRIERGEEEVVPWDNVKSEYGL